MNPIDLKRATFARLTTLARKAFYSGAGDDNEGFRRAAMAVAGEVTPMLTKEQIAARLPKAIEATKGWGDPVMFDHFVTALTGESAESPPAKRYKFDKIGDLAAGAFCTHEGDEASSYERAACAVADALGDPSIGHATLLARLPRAIAARSGDDLKGWVDFARELLSEESSKKSYVLRRAEAAKGFETFVAFLTQEFPPSAGGEDYSETVKNIGQLGRALTLLADRRNL